MARNQVEGRIFTATGSVKPGLENIAYGPRFPTTPPLPLPDPQQVKVNSLVSGLINSSPGKQTGPAAPLISESSRKVTPAPVVTPPDAPFNQSDTLRTVLGSLGQKQLLAKTTPAVSPPQPKSIIGMIGDAAKTALPLLAPASLALKAAKTPAVEGIAKGIGTLAIGMLASINDPLSRNNTAGDDVEKSLREKRLANPNAKNVPYNPTKDVLNDAATGLIGRLTLGKGGAVVKAAQGAGLAIFGAQIVKETPQYIKQIVQTPDPTEKFNLATQLLGSYFLLGHGALTTAKAIPTTKTLTGGTTRVPLDINAAAEFTRSPNPDLTKPQVDAFTELYNKGGSAVKQAIKEGGYDLKNADVTVPTVYGTLINFVRGKIARQEPLSVPEMKVQAAVATQPDTLVPRAEQLIKDPADLQAITQQPTPEAPTTRTMAQINLPETNIQTVPHEVAVPGQRGPFSNVNPAGGLANVADLTKQAVSSTPEQFVQANSEMNPQSLRGFAMSDGAIVAGPGTEPGTISVADVKAKQVVDRPAADVLNDFYRQARGEAPVVQGEVQVGDTNVPETKPKKTLKRVIKTKEDAAQAIVDAEQRKLNAAPKTLKTPSKTVEQKSTPAKIVLTPEAARRTNLRKAETEEQPQYLDVNSIKFKKGDIAKYDRSVIEGVSYLRQVRGDLPFELIPGKEIATDTLASYQHARQLIKTALDNGKVDIRAIGHEVAHELWANVLAPEQRKAFADQMRAEFKSNPEVRKTIAGYNFAELSGRRATVVENALRDASSTFDFKPEDSAMNNFMRAAAKYEASSDKAAFDKAIMDASPAFGKSLVEMLNRTSKEIETGQFSDVVAEELWVDQNGKYVTGRTGKMSDKLKSFLKDFWNAIKKAFGAEYDKTREIFAQSYSGKFKVALNEEKVSKPFELSTTKLKLSEDPGVWDEFARAAEGVSREVDQHQESMRGIRRLNNADKPRIDPTGEWEARLAQADAENPHPFPPALGDIKIGETRTLFDPESTPSQDYSTIAEVNKPDNPKSIVENYDGLLELRQIKSEQRMQAIFKGITKKQDQELFQGAIEYQIDGTTTLPKDLQVIFNKVTKLFEAVGQDAYVSDRIRGLQENYITQIWDTEHLADTSLTPEQTAFLKAASSVSTRFSLEKSVKNYKRGIELGLKPKYDNLSGIVRAYLAADTRAAAGRFLADDILKLGDTKVLAGANGLPIGWRPITKISGLKGYFVSPETYKALKPLDTVSAVRTSKAGRSLLKVNELTKQIVLAGDFFLFKNYLFDAFQASAFGPLRLLYEAQKVTPEIQANLVAYGGLKLSKVNPEEANGLFGKVGKTFLSKKNPYFWADHLSFGLGDRLRIGTASMMERKLVKRGVPEVEAARRAVQFAQDTFGRENMVRAGQSQTVQDVMRLALIAPDYTAARFRTMGKAAAGATFKIKDAQYRAYTYGFLRKMLIAGFAFEMLNLAMSGHTSDKNDEDHKYDLEMKRPDGTKYYVNFLGVIKTDLRFINGLGDLAQGDTTTLTRFLGNKGSTIERVAQSLITGKDYKGDDIVNKYTDGAAEKFKKIGLNIANNFMPLPIQGVTSPNVHGEGPAPRGLEGFVYRTLGFDVYDPKKMPTEVRQSLTELETEKQDVILQTYSLVKSGKTQEAAALIDAFNKKADQVGDRLAKINNINPTDKQSLQELGTSATIDRDKQIKKVQDSKTAENPISNLIDYGVAGVTVAGNKSSTGKQIAKDNAVKAAATRKAKSSSKVKAYKTKKPRKPRKLSLKKGPKARKLSTGKRLAKAPKVRSLKRSRKVS